VLAAVVLAGVAATAQPESEKAAPTGQLPAICIIIDDIGYRRIEGLRAMELPGPIAYAVLPHTPYGPRLAKIAYQLDKEVLLHMPMEAISGKTMGAGGLSSGMQQIEFDSVLDAGLDSVPHVSGVNSHMGSELTQRRDAMGWLMQWMNAQNGLYFVDSITTPRSVALHVARETGVPATGRDVFLDPVADSEVTRRQFQKLVAMARAQGTAIGIAHPYPETLRVLREVLLRPSHYGVELISLAEMVARRVEEAPQQASGQGLESTPPLRATLWPAQAPSRHVH
jgi:polysaccharide deacetylase 2 family uncharacterized protein YibQ